MKTRRPIKVWTLTGYRAGERQQILALAEALGFPFEEKLIHHGPTTACTSLLRRVTLRGIPSSDRAALAPPFPDLLIVAGAKNEPAARAIRRLSQGRTKVVFVGRTWAAASAFDLVVTTPQYRVRPAPQVLENLGTLHRVNPDRLARESRRFREEFSRFPKPRLGVLVGGPSGPYAFGVRAARRLVRTAELEAKRLGACSLLVTTSARTPSDVVTVLENEFTMPAFVYRWRRNDGRNPYHAILADSSALLVTGDSVAMMSEAIQTGKTVRLFDPGRGRFSMRGPDGPPVTADERNDVRWKAWGYELMMRWGPRRLSRDLALFHRRIVDAGHASWADDPLPAARSVPPRDLQRTVARVRTLLGVSPIGVEKIGEVAGEL